MDTVRFLIEDYVDEEQGFRFPTINIYINGRNLIALVEQIEQRNQILRGWEPSRSSYIGFEPRRNCCDEFLGLHRWPRSVLLTCTCTFEECDCIMAKVTIDSQTVRWDEIGSPWLDGATPSPWVDGIEALDAGWVPFDYSGLGPFIFDREQYMNALDTLTEDMANFKSRLSNETDRYSGFYYKFDPRDIDSPN